MQIPRSVLRHWRTLVDMVVFAIDASSMRLVFVHPDGTERCLLRSDAPPKGDADTPDATPRDTEVATIRIAGENGKHDALIRVVARLRSNPSPGGEAAIERLKAGIQSELDDLEVDGGDLALRLRFSPECRRLFRLADIGTWELDVENGLYHGDETTRRILGTPSSNPVLRAQELYAKLVPEALRLIPEKIREAVRLKLTEHSYEFGIVGEDDEPRWIRSCACNEFDESGRLIARYGTLRDVTDEPRIQACNCDRPDHVAPAIHGARVVPWEYDVEGNTFTVNPLGAEDAEFPVGRPIAIAHLLARIHPDDREAVSEMVSRQRLDPARPLHIVYRLRAPDGSWKWILARGEYRTDPGAEHGRIYGINTDVTRLLGDGFPARKADLSAPRHRAAMGHWELDLRTSRVVLSPDLAEMLRLEPSEPIPIEAISRMIVPEDRDILDEAIAEGRMPTVEQGGEIALHFRVGAETRVFRVSAVSAKDENGAPRILIGVALDVTDLVQEERRLRESRRIAEVGGELSTVFEWEFDVEKDRYRGSGRLKTLLFGNDFDGCPIREVLKRLDPEKRWTLERCLQGADHEKTTRSAHTRFVRDDGTAFDLRTYAWTVKSEDGRPVRRQGIIQDVTRRLGADDELRHRAEELAARLAEYRVAAAKACCWAWDYEGDLAELVSMPRLCGTPRPCGRSAVIHDSRRKAIRLQRTQYPSVKSDGEPGVDFPYTGAERKSLPPVRAWGLLSTPSPPHGGSDTPRSIPQPVRAAYWELDLENDRYRGGDSLRAFFGLDDNQAGLERKYVREMIHPEDRDRVDRERTRILAERPSEAEISFRFIVKGRIRFVSAYVHHEFDADGELIFQSGIFVDVTERERINAAVLRIASEPSDENVEEFLRRMAFALAETVDAAAVSVATRADAPGRMQTLVLIEDDSLRPNREFDADLSIGAVLGRHTYRLVSEGAENHPVLASLENPRGIFAYAGITTGEPEDDNEIDILVAFRNPVETPESVERIVRLFATRIALNLKRHRAEAGLRESEALFRDMAQNSIFAIRILQDDRYVYANSRYHELFHCKEGGLLGRRVSDFVDDSTWDAIRYRLNRARRGIIETFDQHTRLKDGTEMWLRGFARPITFRGRTAFMAVFVDVSDHKRLEEELRAAIDRFTLGVKAGRMDVWEVNIETDVCTLNVNGHAEGLFSPGTHEFTVAEYVSWIHPNDRREVRRRWMCLVHGESGTYAAEYRIKPPTDADWRWIAAVAEVVKWDTDGNPQSVIGIQRNITEEKENRRRLAEQAEQLQHSQKMDAVGQLAGGVAHEFNNLLQVISGYCELLQDVTEGNETAHDYLDALSGASRRGSELVRQLLQFSHKETPRTAPVRLDRVVEGMRKMLERVLGENIRLDFVHEAGRLVIPADEAQLRQVIMNLCINARDAVGPRDGHIEIRLERRNLGEEKAHAMRLPAGEYAVLSVADDGPGVPPDIQDRLFEPFFTTKEVGKGTGLGLSAVHGIVEHHRGAIRLESTQGEGTIFYVYLPTGAETPEADRLLDDAPQAVEPTAVASGRTQMTALVAEDNPAVLELARTTLGSLGIRVIAAQNGAEAVEQFREHRDEIDFLFFDVLMPKFSGPEAYERIREMAGDLPAIFATGYGDRAVNLPQGDIPSILLPKPYSTRTLQEAIEGVLAAY